jgi:hypothetical protein
MHSPQSAFFKRQSPGALCGHPTEPGFCASVIPGGHTRRDPGFASPKELVIKAYFLSVTNGTLPSSAAALQFSHGFEQTGQQHRQKQVRMLAVRDERTTLRMREVLLLVPEPDRHPALSRRPLLLPCMSRSLRLQDGRLSSQRFGNSATFIEPQFSRKAEPDSLLLQATRRTIWFRSLRFPCTLRKSCAWHRKSRLRWHKRLLPRRSSA